MKIVKATIEDVTLIADIKTKAYRDEKERFKPEDSKIPKWFHNEWYIDMDENLRLIKEYDVYLLKVDDNVIGTFWIQGINENTVELEDFCILPEYQGLGFGFKALLMMEDLYSKNKKWILGTPFYSLKNHYLYEKAGYKKVGIEAEGTVFLYEKVIS